MKKLVLLLIALAAIQLSFGQLSGTKTIPGDYATIQAAVAALNSQGVGSGGVTFNVAAGHTETISAPISLTATGTSANPIIFQKSGGGASPLITAFVGTTTPSSVTQDGIWNLVGSDYVTINGIDLTDPNSTNPATMEYGYALFKADAENGCQNNNILNCVVTMSRENNASGSGPSVEGSKAILVSNATVAAQTTALTTTTSAGTNSYNKFYTNTLQNCNYGIALSGYAAATPFTAGDFGNDVGGSAPSTGNTILNFGGATGATNPSAAIRANNQWDVNISYNTINNNNGGGVNHPSTFRGIYAQAGTSANANINYNNITLKGGGTTSQVALIENAIGSTAAGNTVNINNNTLTGEYLTATTGVFYGIYSSASAANINISNNSLSNFNYSAATLAGSGNNYLIYNSGAATSVTMNANTVSNYFRTGTTGGTTIGIYTSSGTTQTVTNNTVSNLSIDGAGTASILYGIQVATGTIVVNGNTIQNLACIKTTGTGALYGIYDIASPTNENYNNNIIRDLTHNGTGIVYGIYTNTTTGIRTVSGNQVYNISGAGTTVAGIYQVSSSPTVFKNKVYNIQSTNSTTPTVSGIILGSLGTSGVANVYNNLVGDIKAPAANSSGPTAPSVRGINITTATATTSLNLSFNTVYLDASSSGANFSTAGIFVTTSTTATTAALTLKDNIIINESTPAGTGLTVAHQRSSTALNNFVSATNNNLYYAGTPSSNRLIFYDGTTANQSIGEYQLLVAPRESSSITEDANFKSTVGSSADFLHINELIPTQIESGGTPVTGITDDFDGNARNATTPDIGADEFAGTAADLTPPFITYTPLPNTPNTTERILTATITDNSGVPTVGIGLPRLYWNINGGAYTGVTATSLGSGQYSFAFGTGVLTGDLVRYYIVAQDLATPPNVGAAPSAGAGSFTADPPAAGTPPTTPSSYTVTTEGLSGTYTVGVAMFNNATGKNIRFEKVVSRVMKEVDVEIGVDLNNTTEAMESSHQAPTVKQWMEVEEISWVPMENGQPFLGELFVKADQIPEMDGREVTGIYATITAAFADLNLKGVSGPVTFVLTDATYPTETYPLIANINNTSKPTPTNTITLKPATGVTTTISGASAGTQIFRILESYFTIDGSNAGGTDRSLTIENTSTTTPQVILVGSLGTTPRTNVTIKNCNIINGVNSSSAVIISDGTVAATAGYFNNITFQNNSVQKAYIGVYCISVVAAGNGSGLTLTGNNLDVAGANSVRLASLYVQGVDGATISNNSIGNMVNTTDASNLSGMWLATGTVNTIVSGNIINTMSGSSAGPRAIAVSSGNNNANLTIHGNTITNLSTASSTPPYGIYVFSTTGNVTLSNNTISGLLNTNTGGYGARAINLLTTLAASNIKVFNNVITDVKCTGDASTTYWGVGIAVDGTMGGVNVYHNSVYISGSYAGYTSATVTAAFYNSSTSTNLDVRDNIFVNNFDNTNSTTDKAFAINSQAANTAFANINYNDYFVSGATGVLGYLGADRLTLADWQTATGKDANSQNLDPAFVSTTDLHPTNAALDNLGQYITTVTTDITGVSRTNPPDMGAYEFGSNPVVSTSDASAISCSSATLNGTINANGFSVNTYFDYGLTTDYGNSVPGTPATVTGTTDTPVSAVLAGLPPSTTYQYRLRGVTSTGVTVYGDNYSFTTSDPSAPVASTSAATGIGSTTATMNGIVTAGCQSTTVTFEYGLTAAYGTTVIAIESPVSGNDPTNVSYSLTGLGIGDTYHFRVVAQNGSGTVYGSDMMFTTGAVPPTVVTNAATGIGNFDATLNGTVTANNLTSTVTFEWGLTAAYGNTVAAVPGTVSGMTPTPVNAAISGLNFNTTYHFRCVAVNSAGTTYGADQVFTTLCPVPAAAGAITGPDSLCQGSTGNVYSIAPVTYATGYAWTVPSGATITNGANTPSITVSYGTSASSGNVTVSATNECGTGASSSLAVDVYPLPVPVISGADPACVGSTYAYSTATGQSGYTWTVSAGGQIMSGAGTATVQVKWNSTGAQWVSVNYTSQYGCPGASPTVKNVSVSGLPSPTIAGSSMMCEDEGLHVYTTEAGFNNYVWTVTAGGTIVSGQGTYQIEVNWATPGNQTVTVNYSNASGCNAAAPASFPVTVLAYPAAAGAITGNASLCDGTQGNYSVSAIANASGYEWTVPAFATIIEGLGTNSIKVQFGPGAASGNITVYGTNSCGNGPASPAFFVTVNPIPAKPEITVDDNYLLTSNAPDGNQWYFNGAAIDGATGQTYQVEEEGEYWVVVTLNGCSSEESNHLDIIFTGLGELPGSSMRIYPVPNSGQFTLTMTNEREQEYQIYVINSLGVKIYEKNEWMVNGKSQLYIDLGAVSKGVYTLVVRNENNQVTRKILVTR